MGTDHYIDNLNQLKALAESIQVLDLLNPTSTTVNVLTEMIRRAKKIPELERMDFEMDYNFEKIEAEA